MPLLIGAADLSVSPVALIDVVDGPGPETGAVTLEPPQVVSTARHGLLALVRVSRTKHIESSGTARHSVSDPSGYSAGLLRVSGADRGRAAVLWRDAARTLSDSELRDVAPIDLALLTLVRGGLPVTSLPLGLYSLHKGETPVTAVPGSGWQQRLRNSSRGDDGAFSRTFVRPVSRRLTSVGLRLDWRPNVVTFASFVLGLLAAAMVLAGTRCAFVVAAGLLLLSLVVDCVDGEIARFTRSYSKFGAWLDGVSDRIKEFAVIATVTVVGVRQGHELWSLSIVLITMLTIRQIEDHAYHARLRAAAPQPGRVVPLTQRDDGGPDTAVTSVAEPLTSRQRLVRTIKQVLHVPIAERYLIMAVGLLTGSPVALLVALTVAVGVAFLWTHFGRLIRALTGRDHFDPTRPDVSLNILMDLGPLARSLAATVRAPVVAAWVAVVLVGFGSVDLFLDATHGRVLSRLAPVAAVALAAVLLGPGCVGASRSRLGWQLPGWIVASEGALVLGVTAGLEPSTQWVGYAWFGAIAWHHYDITYRVRETGRGPSAWVERLTLGAEGRMLLLVLWWALGWDVALLCGVATPLLLFGWFGESRYSWRSMVRPQSGSR
ncbi:MAG: CDP-alcohol phosphatidyltransferase family protein [Humibacillus sp.]|nr:CDP-alcohol phosphatidyltransferase family protein [Humibacillus sp.]